MVIGFIGLTRSQFANYCKNNGYDRVTENEYKSKTDKYVLIDNMMHIHGRCFDKLLDFEPLRAEVYKRMPVDGEYHFCEYLF